MARYSRSTDVAWLPDSFTPTPEGVLAIAAFSPKLEEAIAALRAAQATTSPLIDEAVADIWAAQAAISPIMHEAAAAMSAAQAATSPIIEEILAAKWAPQETVGGNVFVGLEARANETFVDDEYLIENTELRSANARLSSRLS